MPSGANHCVRPAALEQRWVQLWPTTPLRIRGTRLSRFLRPLVAVSSLSSSRRASSSARCDRWAGSEPENTELPGARRRRHPVDGRGRGFQSVPAPDAGTGRPGGRHDRTRRRRRRPASPRYGLVGYAAAVPSLSPGHGVDPDTAQSISDWQNSPVLLAVAPRHVLHLGRVRRTGTDTFTGQSAREEEEEAHPRKGYVALYADGRVFVSRPVTFDTTTDQTKGRINLEKLVDDATICRQGVELGGYEAGAWAPGKSEPAFSKARARASLRDTPEALLRRRRRLTPFRRRTSRPTANPRRALPPTSARAKPRRDGWQRRTTSRQPCCSTSGCPSRTCSTPTAR